MSAAFDAAIDLVLSSRIEGGFQASPDDPGNWTGGRVGAGQLRGTNMGISAATYPALDIEHLTRDDAIALYRCDFWSPAWDDLPRGIAVALFDCGVNQQHPPDRWLQTVLGVTVDGVIGAKTVAAASVNPGMTLRNFMAFRLVHYAALPTFADEGMTWCRRVLDVYRACLAMQ